MTGIMAATAQGLCLSGLEHETRVPAGRSLRSHGKRRTSSSPAGEPAIGYEPHQRYRDENARDQIELAQVNRALDRIEQGTYGLSEVSGKPIPIERLEAVPSATTLVDESRSK